LYKILLGILTFVDVAEISLGSLKVWNWNVLSYKLSPKSINYGKK